MTSLNRLFDSELDTCGLKCPEPVMLLHSCVRDMAVGEVVKMLATDVTTQRDIPQFCRFLGHDLVEELEQDGIYTYLIRKGERQSSKAG